VGGGNTNTAKRKRVKLSRRGREIIGRRQPHHPPLPSASFAGPKGKELHQPNKKRSRKRKDRNQKEEGTKQDARPGTKVESIGFENSEFLIRSREGVVSGDRRENQLARV